MKNRRLFWLIIYLLSAEFVSLTAGGFKQPIESLGNIWIFTIDKSGSMLSVGPPSIISKRVAQKLASNTVIEKIDFTKDRFVFFNSGFRFNSSIGLANQLRTSDDFSKSFIHHTDQLLHQFSTKDKLIKHIDSLVSTNNFIYNLSFVSQIRVFSIKKAVDLLIKNEDNMSFTNLYIVTITDDGEQNDQWLNDYRNLKLWAPSKVDEVKKANIHYIYNHLTGVGGGMLDQVFSDERFIPHVWIYK